LENRADKSSVAGIPTFRPLAFKAVREIKNGAEQFSIVTTGTEDRHSYLTATNSLEEARRLRESTLDALWRLLPLKAGTYNDSARGFAPTVCVPEGFRFGFPGIIGLIPGICDVLDALVSLYVVIRAISFGVPRVAIAPCCRIAFSRPSRNRARNNSAQVTSTEWKSYGSTGTAES
jgi:Domain of unknown function (DUF4112)